jgi:hypothetical protein
VLVADTTPGGVPLTASSHMPFGCIRITRSHGDRITRARRHRKWRGRAGGDSGRSGAQPTPVLAWRVKLGVSRLGGRFPTPSIIVCAYNLFPVAGHAAQAVVAVTAEFAGFIAIATVGEWIAS